MQLLAVPAAPHGAQGLPAPQGPQGLQGPHGALAAHGLHGPHAAFAAQGLHGLHGPQAPFAAHGLQGLQEATTLKGREPISGLGLARGFSRPPKFAPRADVFAAAGPGFCPRSSRSATATPVPIIMTGITGPESSQLRKDMKNSLACGDPFAGRINLHAADLKGRRDIPHTIVIVCLEPLIRTETSPGRVGSGNGICPDTTEAVSGHLS